MLNKPVRRRLPKRVWLGPTFWVEVIQTTQAQLQAHLDDGDEDEIDGLWDSAIGPDDACFGIIYILKTHSLRQKWEVLRHELIHAIHDIDAWLAKGGLEK